MSSILEIYHMNPLMVVVLALALKLYQDKEIILSNTMKM